MHPDPVPPDSGQFDRIDNEPRSIRELLATRGLALKKRWGQNFMTSPHARERVVGELAVEPDDLVWEIGPGLGAITALLVERAGQVVVFEVDHGLIRVIRDRFGDAVSVVPGDAVRTIAETAPSPHRIIGNLPYRSAAAIITTVLEHPRLTRVVTRMVFTVQREMALRMVAGPGSSDYSPLSVLCAVTARVRLAGDLSRGNFYPAPDVVSSIVTFDPTPIDEQTRRLCSICARSLFAQRRKTVGNTAAVLASALRIDQAAVRRAIEQAGFSLSARAEELPPGAYLDLARLLGGASETGSTYSGRT